MHFFQLFFIFFKQNVNITAKFIFLAIFAFFINPCISSDQIFFLVKQPDKLNYIYRINPSYGVGTRFPSYTYEDIKLILADPVEGCVPLVNNYKVKSEVVLIERGECSFTQKVLNAEKAGATMVIITDSKGATSELIDMLSDNVNPRANIPAAFLSGANGRILRNYLNYEDTYIDIQIPLNYTVRTPEYNTPPWESILY